MEPTRVVLRGRQVIQAYHEGGFRIAGTSYQGSVLVLPERSMPWSVGALDQVTVQALGPITGAEPAVDILVLGCGARLGLLPQDLRQSLRAAGIALEPMATGAACRTFNVLLADDRRVAAALIAL